MIYVGTDTHEKLNLPNFWPDPNRLNIPPKDPVEIKAEIARLKAQRLERRKVLEERAKELGITSPASSSSSDDNSTSSSA
ncbi:Pet100p [Sugiyamaella lignohabitans]|uniref:Pet100p n=1 Tax=Sugiyamaella lignohabitans TaxID=796027 RepID=A0A161HMJ9_9ASCO|nr:Pet100p [Sugiyamaella lignohabitans]ANB15007.1 Pet100p [Sugiyamaella lignohabitans]